MPTVVELPDKTEIEFPEGMDELAIHREIVKAFPNLGQPSPSERASVPAPDQAGVQLKASPAPLTQVPQAFPAQEQALADLGTAQALRKPAAIPAPSEAEQQTMLTGVAQPEAEIQPIGKEGSFLRGATSVAASVLNRPEYLAALANPATAAAIAIRYTPEVVKQFGEDLGKATQGDNEALGRAAAIGIPALLGGVKAGKTVTERLSAQAQLERAISASNAAHIDDLARENLQPSNAQVRVTPPKPPTLLPETQSELNKLLGGPSAIPERSPKTVSVEKPPGDSATVGARVEEPKAPTLPQGEREPQPQPPAQGGSPVRDVAPPEPAAKVSVPLMVTKEMEQGLSDLGYTAQQRRSMKPEQAQDILSKQISAPKPAAEGGASVAAPKTEPTPAGKVEPAGAPAPELPKPMSVDDELSALASRLDSYARPYEGGQGLPAGAEGIEYRWRADGVREFRDAIRRGESLDQAEATAKAKVREWIARHNARRPNDVNWQRWIGSADSEIENARRLTESKPPPVTSEAAPEVPAPATAAVSEASKGVGKTAPVPSAISQAKPAVETTQAPVTGKGLFDVAKNWVKPQSDVLKGFLASRMEAYDRWKAAKGKARQAAKAVLDAADRELEQAKKIHRDAVEQAYNEGKPVPPDVLADYPDLKNLIPTKAMAPADAASKVESQVREVARTEGQRPAKEVKSELVDRLEQALKDAPPESEVKSSSYTTVKGKRVEVPDSAGKITINIPGDGDFTIRNTKEAIGEVLESAKRLKTSAKEPATKITPNRELAAEILKKDVKDAVTVYGDEANAYQKLSAQLDRAEELGLEEPQRRRLERLIDELEKRIDAPREKALADLNSYRRNVDNNQRGKPYTREQETMIEKLQGAVDAALHRTEQALGRKPWEPRKPAAEPPTPPAEPMRQGPGARTYTPSSKPEAPESYEGTGLKNAIGDLERHSYGFAERTPAEKQAMAEAWLRAKDAPAETARNLARQLEANPKRGLTGDESALLLRHKVDLENALNDAAERTITESDPARKAEAMSDVDRLRSELETFLDAIAKRGTEWGLEGRWRQALAYEDYTFATQERLLRASKGGAELTKGHPNAEYETLVRDLAERKAKVAELEAHLKAQEAKTASADAARMIAETKAMAAESAMPPPHIMRLVQKIRADIKRGADESRKFLAGAQFSASPEVLYHLTRVGADNLLEIGEHFGKWSAKMIEDIGERVRPYLDQLWESSKKMAFEDSVKAGEKDKPKVRKQLAKVDKAERQGKVLDALKEAKAEGFGAGELGRYVQEIVKQVVESGVDDYDAIWDNTKKILDDAGLHFEKKELVQAYSDYGKSQAAPTDPVKIRLAQLRGEAQKALGLQDVLEKHRPPLATGQRRVPVSDLYRRTVAKINEAMRELGIVATNPERQLADALQARKTYRQNRIKDLRHELATGERIVRGKSVPIEDAELKALDKEYRALKAEHAERFPKEGPTQAQQIASASRALDREITTLEEQIRTGNVLPEAPRTRLSTPELEAKRAKLNALRDQRNELRDLNEEFQRQQAEENLKRQKQALLDQIEAKEKQLAAGAKPGEPKPVDRPLSPELEPLKQRVEELNKQLASVRNPKKSREELALNAMKRRATQRIAEIQDQIARADFTRKPRTTPVKPDAEAFKLKQQVKQLEQKLAEARIKNERANRTWGEWAQDTLVDWARGVKLLSPYVFPKLVVAGITRLTTNPIYRIAGQPLRLIPGLTAKAPVELRMSMRAEAKAVAAILKSPPQAWRKLIKGKSNLDVLEGRLAKSREMSGLVGNSHGMVKEPVRQAAFARAIEIRTEEAVKAGLNPSEPAIAATIESSALADARREIFMNENMITKALVRLPVNYLRRSGKTGAKTIANVVEFLLPIVNVPTNITIAAARLNPAIGFSEALLRLAKAAKEGELSNRAAKLSEADAESIARAFKYGTIGTFLAAYAWLNPDQFGGVYGEGGKKRDLKPGQVKLMGFTTPSWLGHAPELSFLNTVAAARRVYDRYYSSEGPNSAAINALAFSLMAPVKNLPFIDSYLRLFDSYHSPGQTAGVMLRDATLPTTGLLKVLDDQERAPKTFWQEIELGIPRLRSEVPTKEEAQRQQKLQRRNQSRQRRTSVPLAP